MQQMKKIVITGGPCAGKSTAMSWIQKHFTQLGWTVLFVPETATEFISGGVAPWTCGTNAEFQVVQMTLQREKERLFEQAARTMPKDRILIVCDRGMLDNRAYMNEEETEWVMEQIGANEVELRDQYDAVFHLVTAAKANGVDYAIDIYPFYGSDADAALRAGYDVRHCVIGAGVSASHGYERSHRDGLAATFDLLAAYIG